MLSDRASPASWWLWSVEQFKMAFILWKRTKWAWVTFAVKQGAVKSGSEGRVCACFWLCLGDAQKRNRPFLLFTLKIVLRVNRSFQCTSVKLLCIRCPAVSGIKKKWFRHYGSLSFLSQETWENSGGKVRLSGGSSAVEAQKPEQPPPGPAFRQHGQGSVSPLGVPCSRWGPVSAVSLNHL